MALIPIIPTKPARRRRKIYRKVSSGAAATLTARCTIIRRGRTRRAGARKMLPIPASSWPRYSILRAINPRPKHRVAMIWKASLRANQARLLLPPLRLITKPWNPSSAVVMLAAMALFLFILLKKLVWILGGYLVAILAATPRPRPAKRPPPWWGLFKDKTPERWVEPPRRPISRDFPVTESPKISREKLNS